MLEVLNQGQGDEKYVLEKLVLHTPNMILERSIHFVSHMINQYHVCLLERVSLKRDGSLMYPRKQQ